NKDLPDDHHESLTQPEPNLANDLAAETPLQFPQDFCLGDLLELIMQRRLQHAHEKNAVAQTYRRRVRGDKLADNLLPSVNDFGLAETFSFFTRSMIASFTLVLLIDSPLEV